MSNRGVPRAPVDSLVLQGARILDPHTGQVDGPMDIRIMADRIEGFYPRGAAAGTRTLDVSALTLLPGLIDCHVHVTAFSANEALLYTTSSSYVSAWAVRSLRAMLDRGFTTVRDVAGADAGLRRAVAEGLVVGPRILCGGPSLTQTGGHADHRSPYDHSGGIGFRFPSHGVVCDGEVEVRRSAREIFRLGADHLKLMLSGGVASPTDKVENTQFSGGEIRAAVEEASAVGKYVAGHAYSATSVQRGLAEGVRSIEHANFIDAATAQMFCETGAFMVPTLVTYRALVEEGVAWGLSDDGRAKAGGLFDAGLEALRLASRAGVAIAFGTDLLGGMQRRQSEEFSLRSRVQEPLEIIRSATTVPAELMGLRGEVGVIRVGGCADIIGVRGNPADDLGLLAEPSDTVKLVVARGAIVRSDGR